MPDDHEMGDDDLSVHAAGRAVLVGYLGCLAPVPVDRDPDLMVGDLAKGDAGSAVEGGAMGSMAPRYAVHHCDSTRGRTRLLR